MMLLTGSRPESDGVLFLLTKKKKKLGLVLDVVPTSAHPPL